MVQVPEFRCPATTSTVEYAGIFARTLYWRCDRSDRHDVNATDTHEWVRTARVSNERRDSERI